MNLYIVKIYNFSRNLYARYLISAATVVHAEAEALEANSSEWSAVYTDFVCNVDSVVFREIP